MKTTLINHIAEMEGVRPFDVSRELRPAPKKEFPYTVGGRTFETEAEYNEAIADFLNGM
jgi:hypothetical protein